ncbi:hypothetical protein ACH5RR_032748 [Cinchona calisaya]|uniref:Uncharacterized protein n=1 Tax=Cinchona calisaya TaxID=153742 RepID=A0ABD2YJ23_9GENT
MQLSAIIRLCRLFVHDPSDENGEPVHLVKVYGTKIGNCNTILDIHKGSPSGYTSGKFLNGKLHCLLHEESNYICWFDLSWESPGKLNFEHGRVQGFKIGSSWRLPLLAWSNSIMKLHASTTKEANMMQEKQTSTSSATSLAPENSLLETNAAGSLNSPQIVDKTSNLTIHSLSDALLSFSETLSQAMQAFRWRPFGGERAN